MHFQSSYKKSAKTKDKGKRLCIWNSELSPNQPAVQSNIHMNLWFASGTLSCFLFQTEILLLSSKKQSPDGTDGSTGLAPVRSAPAAGRASIPGLGHTSWSQGWLGDGAATAATGVARAPALPCWWRSLEGGRGREGEPGGGVESEGDREGAPRCLSLSPSAQEQQSHVATMVKACTAAWDHAGNSSSTWRASE